MTAPDGNWKIICSPLLLFTLLLITCRMFQARFENENRFLQVYLQLYRIKKVQGEAEGSAPELESESESLEAVFLSPT